MNKVSIANYEGKKVYVGIDVHKRTYHITAICDGVEVKKATVKAHPYEVAKSLNRWFSGAEIYSVYEAGFGGYVLHHTLEKFGIKNIVVNPAAIEKAANDRVKNDSKDSAKLAKQLSFGNLKTGKIPTLQEELSRQAQRTREQYVAKRIRVGNQIKSKLFQFGFIDCEESLVMSEKYLKQIETNDYPSELKFVLDILIDEWRIISKRIKLLEAEIKKDNMKSEIAKKIATVPGIGELSANIIYTELGDMSQFSNESKLFSFLGLVPSEYSSGDNIRRGRISRMGPSRLRHILVEVAWRNLHRDEISRQTYDRISASRGGKKAIVACAKKLIGRIRAMIKTGEPYKFQLSAN